ncbi:MAG: hypothetical protein A2W93_14445 [Bacteroidetes bacterium GWF2_43_63]|nr:MAG: hypothetical protein A2W94_01015 [Bacteroidetes bacterium GWE2_42_42]OFY52540.1 MAG: hypothetical protein A2W93_14445 [Bacteroidetes bacterium GWF2_43_63]HBG71448.1 hypothetical protein [Bacteroidales bacterium]HCB60800.1 hypothetical protein [Bacteroidales bacterium]HCY23475.1 hypothetical protein [Bacteroidales bacterium]
MSKQQNPFAGIPLNEVEDQLKANAHDIQVKNYFREFTPEEMIYEQERYQSLLKKIEAEDEKLKAAKDDYKAAAKPLKADLQFTRTCIKTRGRSIRGNVYIMFDEVNGLIEEYDNRGNLIVRRPLTPEEKKAPSIPFNSSKTGERNAVGM